MVRYLTTSVGIDPWGIDMTFVRWFTTTHEQTPVSRYRFGSPCRFIRSLDMLVHVLLPEAIAPYRPVWACYLRTTSPRWGRSWRTW